MEESGQTSAYKAIRRLLRPLVALLLKNGVMFREFAAWCKEAYVEVAAADYGKRGRPTNQSRIALLTGLDRKEIKRLRDLADAEGAVDSAAPKPGHLSRVLSAWHQEPRYADHGVPRPLGVDDEFIALCAEFGGDVPTSAILKELVRVGAVHNDASGDIVATSRYYMPQRAEPAALLRSADVLRDIGNTVVHNLYRESREPSRFEGRATNLNIGVSAVPDFRDFVERRAESFLEDVDAWLSEREAKIKPNEQTLRLGLGTYWLQGETETGQ